MLQAYRPPPHWSPWLDGAVCVRMEAGQGVSRFPAMARAMLTLQLVRAQDGRWALVQPATFHTLTTRPSAYAHAGTITALGLIVRPAAAACLLDRTCGTMTDEVLPWSAIAGEAEAYRLAEEVECQRSERAGLAVLLASFGRAMRLTTSEQWLQMERLCDAVGQAGAHAGNLVGLGRRQLERRCLALLGMSPKPFARLERFHHALSAVVVHDALPLAHAAFDGGYCDQSHLTRDARQLGGATIGDMRALAHPGSAWWALSTPRIMGAVPDLVWP